MAAKEEESGWEWLAAECSPLLQKRLSIDKAQADELAKAYVLGAMDHALIRIKSQTVGPTALSADRVQLVESIAGRLGRLPTTRELTAMLRITETPAKTALKNVLATSDRIADLALRSAFAPAKQSGTVGTTGKPPGGKKWVFQGASDLDAARTQLEERGVKYSTLSEKDGEYVLVVDKSFNPAEI